MEESLEFYGLTETSFDLLQSDSSWERNEVYFIIAETAEELKGE